MDEELSFSLDGDNFGLVIILEGLIEGIYVIYVKYGDCCVFIDMLDVFVLEDFSLVLLEDQVIDWGSSLLIEFIIDVGFGVVYKWYLSIILDCSNCEKVVVLLGEMICYFL